MSKFKQVPIRYTSRDFNTIKNDLVEYAKRFYPDTYKDFSAASFGSLMLDTVAYVGDILSFYLDYQANESFLSTAVEYDNILKLGEQVGYKLPLNTSSHGTIALYVVVPARSDAMGPDLDYLPILRKGSKFSSTGGARYVLLDDVNFADPDNEIVVASANNSTGAPTSYAIKAYGQIISGELFRIKISVGEFKRFRQVKVADRNITEIIEVLDDDGHEYFQVPYLSQDVIYVPIVNRNPSTNIKAPSIMKAIAVPRRFTVKKGRGNIILQFGYGSSDRLKTKNVTDPSNVVLKIHGRDYDSNETFDPSNLISTDKFGVVPANTTLTITYRSNTIDNVNAPTNTVINIADSILKFKEAAGNIVTQQRVRTSLECTNDDPITGDVKLQTIDEIKEQINGVFATQNRAVTKQDYINLCYRMPSKYGKIKKATIVQDPDSLKRNLNIHVLGEDTKGKYQLTNNIIKRNLKTWLTDYKMINDTIDILDGKIANYGIKFVVIPQLGINKYDVLPVAVDAVKELFLTKKDFGESLIISEIYSKLNKLEEVSDTIDVTIVNKQGGSYSDVSFSIFEHMSPDGRVLNVPEDYVLELKFPNLDIQGAVK